MKHFTLFKTWLLAVVMLLVGGGSVWAQDLIYTLDLNAQNSEFGSSNTYEAKSGTVNGVTWYINAGSCQSKTAVWLGANNATNRTNLAKLSDGVNNRGGAIATALGIQTSTVGYYAIVGANAIENVETIKVKADATGGTAPSTMWCLYTTDGGTTYTVLGSKSSPGTTEQTFTAASVIGSAQYAFVFYSSAYGTYRVPYFKFYKPEVQADPYTVSFNAGTGTYTGGNLTETSGGAGIELPAATGCGAWTFAGWATTAVTETTTAPTLLLADSKYYPTEDVTLYAVYSVTEGGGNGTLTITRSSLPSGTGYTESTWSSVATTGETITGKMKPYLNTIANIQLGETNTPHPYNIDAIPGAITNISITMPGTGSLRAWTPYVSSSSKLTSSSEGTSLGTQTFTSTTGTLSWDLDASDNYKYFYLSLGGNTNIASIDITYTSGTTTYNSNPNCSAVSISVSEDEFNFSAYVNQSDEDMFEVTAYNLTDDMNFALTGDDTMFDFELADDFDAVAGGIVYVYYKPTAAGNHSATLTISSTGADDVEIALSGKAIPQLDWANLQWPGSGSITVGGAYVIYGQVYQPGLTTVEGNEADIQVWAGYSTDNTNPNTWTNWITASFDAKQGNNYQYKLDLGAEIDAPGTYYYAFRYKLGDAEYVYGGYNYIENEKNGGFWGDDNVSGVLTINTDTSKDIGWGNVQSPASGSIFIGETFDVYGQVYKLGVTDQEDINENVKAWIGFTTDYTTNPADWDEGAWSAATFNKKKGDNYEFGFNLASAITSAGEYYYVYRYQYDGGAYYYGGTDNQEWSQDEFNFGELTVAILTAPVADQPSGNLFKQVEANWSKVAGVDGYILSVYQKETVQDVVDHVSNGSFEAWTGTKPDGWFGDKTNIAQKDVVEYTESAQDGSKAVQLINATDKHKRFTTDVVTVQEDVEYTITFWARGKGDIRTGLYDGRSTGSGYSAYNDYVGVDSDEWIEYSQKVTATMNTSVAEFIFSVMNTVETNGHLQIDNVSITATMDVTNILHVSGSPVDVTDADNENVNTQPTDPFIYTFTGLKRTTAYYYSVVAYKGDLQSPASNEISFTSGPLTNLDQTLTSKAIYAHHEKVFVNTTAGTSIEIFNVAGQKVSTTIAHDGLNIIPVNYQGVLLVKVGGEVVKLMCR